MRLLSSALLLCLAMLPAAAQIRTVPLSHTDYLRFIDPEADAAVGFDVKHVVSLIDSIVSQMAGPNMKKGATKGLSAMKEIDHVWISMRGAGTADSVALMTGHFERGGVAEMTKAPGMIQVFLGSPQAILIGSEPAVKAALLRLHGPPSTKPSWVAEQARALSPDHDFWVALQPRTELQQMANQLDGIKQFSMGAKLHDEASLDGELVAASASRLDRLLADIDTAKARMSKENPKAAASFDNLILDRSGSSVRFSVKGRKVSATQISTELSGQLKSMFGQLAALSPQPKSTIGFDELKPRIAAQEKLQAVKKGMTREEVVGLVGRPLTVMSISGLEEPRETWTYQLASGKKITLRLENGIVTAGSLF